MADDRGGFIALWRALQDHPVLESRPFHYFGWWCWALLEARWKDGPRCRRGEFLSTTREIASMIDMSVGATTEMLQWFESEGMIERERSPYKGQGKRRTKFRVVNYNRYQNLGHVEHGDGERRLNTPTTDGRTKTEHSRNKEEQTTAYARVREGFGNDLGIDPAVAAIVAASEAVIPDWLQKQSREQWAASVAQAFPDHDIPAAMHDAADWCARNGKTLSTGRIRNWLKKEDPSHARPARRKTTNRERMERIQQLRREGPWGPD